MLKYKKAILDACHADCIPEGESGLWHVKKLCLSKSSFIERPKSGGLGETLPAGTWTSLCRFTAATIHLSIGEVVMHDFPREVNKHLIFMLRASGNVLVTGLGLGCVARGLLANPKVSKVTVLENSPDVLKLVGVHMERPGRLEIIYAEAEQWIKSHPEIKFDCAWHDLWTDTSAGEPPLAVKHSSMMAALCHRVKFQGAWEFPRDQRRLWRKFGVI